MGKDMEVNILIEWGCLLHPTFMFASRIRPLFILFLINRFLNIEKIKTTFYTLTKKPIRTIDKESYLLLGEPIQVFYNNSNNIIAKKLTTFVKSMIENIRHIQTLNWMLCIPHNNCIDNANQKGGELCNFHIIEKNS
ncbi:MAG: hypothetical protein SVZ03_10915 [Spirochaetota bacterium]|nr:hypothetical protein [Spirochaetota bacterium]